MNIAATLVAKFLKRVAFRDQHSPTGADPIAMERLRHGDDGFGGCRAVIGSERNVALQAEQRRDAFGMGGAALLLLPPQILRGAAQRRTRKLGLALAGQSPRRRQRLIDDPAEIRFCPPAGDFLLVNIDRGANRLLHPLQIEQRIGRDTTGHFANEPLGHVTRRCRFLGVFLDQQVQNGGVGDVPRQIGRVLERAVRIPAQRFQPAEMGALRLARSIRRREVRPARGNWLRLRRQQQLAVIQREPGFPLGVGYLRALPQRIAERRQTRRQIGIFPSSACCSGSPGADPAISPTRCDHGVAMGDVDIKLVERVAAQPLKVFLDFHLDVMACQIAA